MSSHLSFAAIYLLSEKIESERARKTSLHTPPVVKKTLFSPTLRYDLANETKDESNEVKESVQPVAPQHDTTTSTSVSTTKAIEKASKDEPDEDEFNPYLFISSLPPHTTISTRGRVCLTGQMHSDRLTLVLDLDETLVHCTVEPIAKADLTFPVAFNGAQYQVFVRKRPYLDFFLETVSKTFEVSYHDNNTISYLQLAISCFHITIRRVIRSIDIYTCIPFR